MLRRLILLVLTLCCLSDTVKADGVDADVSTGDGAVFFLDWNSMPLDSVLPRYTEVVPLESDFRFNKYKVSLLYPEWQEMTVSEAEMMKQWSDSVSAEIRINTYVGVMRGKGLLDVDFIPVAVRNGKFMKLLSAKMEIEALPCTDVAGTETSSLALKAKAQLLKTSDILEDGEDDDVQQERYVRTSKLSSGKWVKIAITEDGMYRLTSASLKKMGFANPQNVHLYGYGGHRLSEVSNPEAEYDDLVEVPLYKSGNDTWLFWGNGLVYWNDGTRVFNQYARQSCYFLTEESSPSKIETIPGLPLSQSVVKSFTDYQLYEKDETFYFECGRNLFEAYNIGTSGSKTYKLTLPGQSLGKEQLTVVFTAAASSPTVVSTTVNGNALSNFSVAELGSYQYGNSASKTFDVSKYKTGSDWTVRLASTTGHDAHLDYLAMSYDRLITPGSTFVAFTSKNNGNTTFEISGFSNDCKLMRIGQPGVETVLIDAKPDGGVCQVGVDNGSYRYVCFNANATYPEPSVIGDVANQNLHAIDSVDMVIIIPASGMLQKEAERLAELHETYDGLRTCIVRADQIYNEFSSGTPDATAYRRFMKMLYDRAGGNEDVMPRYLLLMGDCAFDNRMLSSAWAKHNPDDYLLCYESENSFSDTRSYVMEDYFGLLDDGEGKDPTRDKVDIGVGRFPVTKAKEASIMVDKVANHLSNQYAGSWKNIVLMLGDDGDDNSHMRYCDEVADTIMSNNPDLEVKKIMWDAYTRVSTISSNTFPEVTSIIKNYVKDGVMAINYTGHGATYLLSHEMALSLSDFEGFKGDRLPFWFTAACDVMPFDSQKRNIGEVAVLNEGGGALAFLGTTRTVYAFQNWQLNRLFSKYLFGTDSKGERYRVGDAIRLTKSALIGIESGSLRENKLQYALLGDPALVIGNPLNKVRLDSIVSITSGVEQHNLRAGEAVKMYGHLEGPAGEALSDFMGVISARVFDAVDTITCKQNDKTIKEAFVFTDRNSLLFAGQDSVRNGSFVIPFVVPKDIKYSDGTGRMVFYAISNDKKTEANGSNEDFVVGGSALSTDSIGPEMEITLNGEYGGVVNSTPYLTVRFSDESGVNSSGSGLGHDIALCVDNDPSRTYVLNDYYVADFGDYTKGSLGFTIPGLPAGRHSLTVRSWDMLNNTSISQIDFDVDTNYSPSILNLSASPNPAVKGTTFHLAYDLPGSECQYVIEVFDFSGRRLWMYEGHGSSATGQFAVPWNLSVGYGLGRISPGVYLYRVSLTSGESKLVTKSQKLIVN